MTDSVCPLPSRQVDEQYLNIISQYERLGPEDPSFDEAIKELKKITPSAAANTLMACKKDGGRKRRRSHKTRKSHRGGAPSKKACYIKALGKITMGIAGVGAAGYYYLAPFMMSASGTPCAGLWDQVVGYGASWFDPSLSCASRQKAYDQMVLNYITNIAKVTGISVGAALLKAPNAFKSVLKYLAAKECPELFDNYSLEDLRKDLSGVSVAAAPAASQPAASQPAAVSQAAPSRQSSDEPEESFDDPEDTTASRRGARRAPARRGGKKQRRTKTKRGGKVSRRTKHKTRRVKRRQTKHRR